MRTAASARKDFVVHESPRMIRLDDSFTVLLELLSASDMTLEEGFCAFAYGGGDGDFDPKHRMEFKEFHAVAVDHLSSRLSESAIAELFYTGLDLNGDGFVDGEEWRHALRLNQQSITRGDALHAPILSNSARLQQHGGTKHSLLDSTLDIPSNRHFFRIQPDDQDITAVSVERHRHTPMWIEEHTREGIQAYLDGLRRVYFHFISIHGSLCIAFAALCKCDIETSHQKCLPGQMFGVLLSEQFPEGTFNAAIHSLVWYPASSGGVTQSLFCAVMSRAPLLLPYQSCHTMRCILSLCKSNSISCRDLFLQFGSRDDGLCDVSTFAERCCELLSGHCSASDVVAVWSGLFGQGCLAVSLDQWAIMWAPAECLFAVDITSCSLADIVLKTNSVGGISGEFYSRPQAEALTAHTRIAAAVMSICSRRSISLETFYGKLGHNHLLLPSHDSFLNGLELQLDENIDALAMEPFWAFVSGGSSLLSAYEWILMLHHLAEPTHSADVAFGIHDERTTVGEVEAATDGASAAPVKGDEGVVETCSSGWKSDVPIADAEGGRGGFYNVDIDARIAHVTDAACDDVEALRVSRASVITCSQIPAPVGSDDEIESPQHAPSSELDGVDAEHTVAEDCVETWDDVALNAVHDELHDAYSDTQLLDESECGDGGESAEVTTTAQTSRHDPITECQEMKTETALGQDEGLSFTIDEHVGAEACANDGVEGRVTLPVLGGIAAAADAVLGGIAAAAAADACALEPGTGLPSQSPSGSLTPFSFANSQFRFDATSSSTSASASAAALCGLAQDVVMLSLQLRNARRDVDRLTTEVRSEREKVFLRCFFGFGTLCMNIVLTLQQVQRVKSIGGKLLKNRDAEHQQLHSRLVLLQKQLVERGKYSAELKTGK